jgi:hypothetical protein
MLISELCRELDKIRDKFGDIKIEVRDEETGPGEFSLINKIEVVIVCKGEKRVWLY